jgi:hypothetical protein
MPFSIKKTLSASDLGVRIVVWNGAEYYSVTNQTGSFVKDQNDNAILSLSSRVLFLFVLDDRLFVAYPQTPGGEQLSIYERVGSSWVLRINSINSVSYISSYVIQNDTLYFLCVPLSNTLLIQRIYSFDGSNLTEIRQFVGNENGTAIDRNQTTGDLYYSTYNESTGTAQLIKVDTSNSEEVLVTVSNSLISNIKLFDGDLYITLIPNGTQSTTLNVLSSISTGATLSQIGSAVAHSSGIFGYFSKVAVFNGVMYFLFFASGAYRVHTYNGTSFSLFQNLGNENTLSWCYFSENTSYLAIGFRGVFYSTAVTCSLEFGDPAYTKTNETADDANDGTITVNAISSFTKQYSINGGSTWQSSNVFSGLAPDNYTITVRDSQGCEISQSVIIAPFGGAVTPVSGSDVVSVDLKPVNRYNFIQWFRADGTINFRRLECENENWDLPNTYQRTSVREIKHYPVAAIGELFSFYINFTDSFTDPDFNDFRLALIRPTGLLEGHSSISLLSRDLYDGNSYNIYCENVTIEASVPVGIYRMAIYNSSNGNLIFISNEIEVMRIENAEAETVRMQWSHPYNIYKYYYQNVPEYVHNLRLRINEIDRQSEGELTQYRSVSGGDLRNQAFDLDLFVILETNRFDKLAHEAMFVFQAHQTIIINEEQYVLKSLYKTEGGPEMLLKRGRIEFYLQDFSTINRYGPLVDITIIGSEDPLLQGDDGGFIKL